MQQFTENAIMEHFEQMLREMPFDKITVTALARHCEISPNTFYYHFSDIYDLLDQWLVRMLEPYVKSSEQQWQASVKQLLHRLKKEKKLVYHLFNSISRDRLEWQVFGGTYDVFYANLSARPESRCVSEEELHTLADYCCYAFLGFFLRFLWNQMDADVDSEVDRLSALTEPFVHQALCAHAKMSEDAQKEDK